MKHDKAGPGKEGRRPARRASELVSRLLSAIVMAGAALALTWAGLWPFVLLVAAAAGVLAWEWAGITGNAPTAPATLLHGAALIAVAVLAGAEQFAAAGVVVLAAAVLLAALGKARKGGAGPILAAVGLLYFGVPVIALIWLRADPRYGLLAVLFLFVVIWCEDTAGYIFGRLIGGPKLAPSISPGKTWAGFCAGLAAPAVAAFIFAAAMGNTTPAMLAVVGAGLAFCGQIGDLVESANKRAFGVKDASGLIPGHGGLLDRVDAFMFAAAAAALLGLLRDKADPGGALLIWP